MISYLCSGSYFGTFLCYPVSAFLLQHAGWRAIFYAYGSMGLAWGIFYLCLVSDTPQRDRRIHRIELDFIQSSQSGSLHSLQSTVVEPLSEVLRQACRSRAVWALIVGAFCNNFGFYMLVSE